MYIFTTEPDIQKLFINSTRAGGMLLNDTIMHYAGKKIRNFKNNETLHMKILLSMSVVSGMFHFGGGDKY